MTPHRDAGHGTLLIDIRLGKLGRYKAASGTLDVQLFRDLVGMLRQLRRARRWDVLALLVNRHLGPLELHDAFIRGTTDTLPTADHLRPLAGAVERWLAALDRHETTRKQYAWLLGHFGTAHSTLADVPALLVAARAAALRSGHRATFNGTRAAVRVLLRWAVGERHVIYGAATAVEALRLEHRAGNPLSVEGLRALAGRLGDLGPMAWALALTGMRRGEYFGRRFEVTTDRILVHGTKSKASDRTVLKAFPIVERLCSYDHFRDRLTNLTDGSVRVHDFRYTFTRWCEDAGIPGPRIKWYLGHSARSGDVTELYRRGRGFLEYLARDAAALRAFTGEPPRRALEVSR